MIPEFRPDGYLPEGLHDASEADVTFRFGSSTPRRRRLIFRLRKWLELARATRARRFLVDGSFVTDKPDPNDIDAVVLVAVDFEQQVANGLDSAIELETMLLTRNPEEVFAAEDVHDWDDWVEFSIARSLMNALRLTHFLPAVSRYTLKNRLFRNDWHNRSTVPAMCVSQPTKWGS